MRIKKKHQNEYVFNGDVWVRNACKTNVPYVDINNLTTDEDRVLFLENELKNKRTRRRTLSIEEPNKTFKNVVIVSDGYKFQEKQSILADLPFKEVSIFAINGSLAKWDMVGANAIKKRAIDLYITNNPYVHQTHLPKKHNYFPNCVASTRVNNLFIESYKGEISFYLPTPDEVYSSQMKDVRPIIDDYRNVVCASMWLAKHFGAQKILLFCCDNSFDNERPGAIKLTNDLWAYEQQIKGQEIIDANAYWLKQENVCVADCSSGSKYEFIEYINCDAIAKFFNEQE